MKQSKKNAFTLIELIAVLVIMAIIALIVTPLVMNIIRSARTASDKRSIDAYGRSIELAIAGYLMDTGSFPTSIDQLTIEYSGDEIACTTTQLNSDSSVYLAGCAVAGRSVDGYTYGKEETTPVPSYTAYNVGDHVSYNGVTYYVIEDSDTINDTVKLLKENPLTKIEMDNLNLAGITISESNGYGQVQYGSTTDYSTSTVKQVVDAWKNSAVASGDTAIARLLMLDELVNNFGFDYFEQGTSSVYKKTELTPSWLRVMYFIDWTMTSVSDSQSNMWTVNGADFGLSQGQIKTSCGVRPVLELNKSANITKLAS